MDLLSILSSQCAFLVGAGISTNYPSDLPTAKQFLQGLGTEIITRCNHKNSFDGILHELNENNPRLRFERIISILQKYFDNSLSILECFGECAFPNFLHYFFAHMVCSDHIVMTTNFDHLIELALHDLGHTFCQAIEEKDFGNTDLTTTIFKLHGSFKRYENGNLVDSRDTVCASLEMVGKQGFNFALSPQKRTFLSDTLRGMDLFIVGYSGNDDFDIAPLVESIPSDRKMIWIDHTFNEENRLIVTGEDIIKNEYNHPIAKKLRTIIKREIRDVNSVLWARVNTLQFFQDICGLLSIEIPSNSARIEGYRWDSTFYFKQKFDAISLNLGDLFFLEGLLQQLVSDKSKTISAFQNAVSTYKETEEYERVSQALHELCFYQLSTNNLAESEDLAREAEYIDRLIRPDWHPLSLSVLAHIKKFQGHFIESIRLYELGSKEALNNKDEYSASICLSGLGQVLNRVGDYRRAKDAFLRVADLREKLGHIEELAGMRRNIAIACIELGELDEARIFLDEAIVIYEKLFDHLQVASTLHEKGIVLQRLGKLQEAKQIFEQISKIFERYNDESSLALSLYQWAISESIVGNPEIAIQLEELSSKILLKLKDYYNYAHNIQLQGFIQLNKGNREAAKQKFKESIAQSKMYNDQQNIKNCEALLKKLDEKTVM